MPRDWNVYICELCIFYLCLLISIYCLMEMYFQFIAENFIVKMSLVLEHPIVILKYVFIMYLIYCDHICERKLFMYIIFAFLVRCGNHLLCL